MSSGNINSPGQLDKGSSAGSPSKRIHRNGSSNSSVLLFVSVIILVNLCPFDSNFTDETLGVVNKSVNLRTQEHSAPRSYIEQLESCAQFVKLMFTNPIRLGERRTRFILAESKMLGKVAKVLYFKKKFKKLGKKLKKHTIAVPVFTAIPIYEHSYYPSPHVTHVTHGHGMHHAAASSYSTIAAAAPISQQSGQQMTTSASNTNHRALPAYAIAPQMYHGGARSSPAAHQIINAYAPSPPMYVDDTGGLYGAYGNAYGRYDGGYHMW